MGLRLVLVGIVAGLGLDLPSGQEVGSWVRSGQAWCAVALADIDDARMPNGREAFAGATETPTVAGDRAFARAVEEMVDRDRAERAVASEAPRPVVFQAGGAAEGPDFGDALALALNRAEEGDSAFEPSATPEIVPEPPAGPSRVEKLAMAVRLTRQAAGAWMSLLEASGGIALGH